jgi:mannose-1-phosphate guanylyltransferase
VNLYAVIMAGGAGTRFWPVSRRSRPKQLLDLVGGASLIRQTVDRIRPRVAPERILVVTGAEHAAALGAEIPEVPRENLLVEPVGRGTAAAIGLAAVVVRAKDPHAAIAVLPSDHFIRDRDGFLAALEAARDVAADGDYLLTLGMKPTAPETGYGYIRVGEQLRTVRGLAVHRVDRFIEKPDRKRAEGYLADGHYLWNGGVFIWRVDTVLEAIRTHLAETFEGIAEVGLALAAGDFMEAVRRVYVRLPNVSIDTGVLERAGNVLVLPCEVGWHDVGSWSALDDLLPRRDGDNVGVGEHVAIDSRHCVVYSPKKLVATVGVDDLVIVETEDALLVCRKDQAQEVRRVLEELERRGMERLR